MLKKDATEGGQFIYIKHGLWHDFTYQEITPHPCASLIGSMGYCFFARCDQNILYKSMNISNNNNKVRHVPYTIIPALRRPRQEDLCKSKASLFYIVTSK